MLPFHKRLGLSAYYHSMLPWRALAAARAQAADRSPVMVLFYHRVADHTPNAWTISRAGFAGHMAWLRKHFDLVSLDEAQRRVRDGNHRPGVCITFDDGYGENLDYALPLLMAEGIPCTYFVATRHVLEGIPFPHDVALGKPLRPNTRGELRDLAAAGVEIAAHTRSHADLGLIRDREQLMDEVVECKHELETALDWPVRFFSFPYGLHANLSSEAFAMARDAGYHAVCSAYGGYNFPGDDSFHLQRIHADNDLIRLKNWLTVDPRKQRSVKRYEYDLSVHASEPAGACA